jgi:hypothetical protein
MFVTLIQITTLSMRTNMYSSSYLDHIKGRRYNKDGKGEVCYHRD